MKGLSNNEVWPLHCSQFNRPFPSRPSLTSAPYSAQFKPLKTSWFAVQDFEKLFHAELMLKSQCEASGATCPLLPDWVRQYALRAWQDRVYFDRTVSRTQQEVCRTLVELGVDFELQKQHSDDDYCPVRYNQRASARRKDFWMGGVWGVGVPFIGEMIFG